VEQSRRGRAAARATALYAPEPWSRVDENIGHNVVPIGARKRDRVIDIEAQETETEFAEAN
jgi:hypothetical protein